MALQKIVKATARWLGFELVPEWRMGHLEFSRYLADLFKKQDVHTVIDVGANEGQYYDFLRAHVGYRGRVFSYEPNPACHQALASRARKDDAMSVRHVALGRDAGELQLNVMESAVFTSFLEPVHDRADLSWAGNKVSRQVTVPVATLAGEFRRENFEDGVYLKMDTQGFDLNVMMGAGDMLSRCVALQTELSMLPIYSGMPDYREVIDFLEERDFALGAMFPVTRAENGAVIEFDGVFVNVGGRKNPPPG